MYRCAGVPFSFCSPDCAFLSQLSSVSNSLLFHVYVQQRVYSTKHTNRKENEPADSSHVVLLPVLESSSHSVELALLSPQLFDVSGDLADALDETPSAPELLMNSVDLLLHVALSLAEVVM